MSDSGCCDAISCDAVCLTAAAVPRQVSVNLAAVARELLPSVDLPSELSRLLRGRDTADIRPSLKGPSALLPGARERGHFSESGPAGGLRGGLRNVGCMSAGMFAVSNFVSGCWSRLSEATSPVTDLSL